jgi:Sugar kinases, ribokinase family
MPILNIGSLNIDHVYRVDNFVLPGETKHAKSYTIHNGGKGLNQSIAAARAGSQVFHAGVAGRDGGFLVKMLQAAGVDTSLMQTSAEVSGHAIIQVADSGQNCILLYGGTNQMLTVDYVDRTLDAFGSEGFVLLQNETNLVGKIIEKAAAKGLKVALNAAPYSEDVNAYPIDQLDWLIVNEVEGAGIIRGAVDENLLQRLAERFPRAGILLTLGSRGAQCVQNSHYASVGSCKVQAVDTTAAGDTFSGYFLFGVMQGLSLAETLRLATVASALCVQRPGAANSIPTRAEVEQVLAEGTLQVPEVLEW